jgi:hypothetical protein
LILGAFTWILWGLLRGRRRGWPHVMAVVVGAPECAHAGTVATIRTRRITQPQYLLKLPSLTSVNAIWAKSAEFPFQALG